MKQILQSFKTGKTELVNVPSPLVSQGSLLIRSTYSLISPGTERMLVEFGRSSLLSKAYNQPERIKQVLGKIKTDGLIPTLEAVFNKLEEPLPLGYCNVGIVEEIGEGVTGFAIGNRVASNGHHAEFVCVPQNLVVKIPDNVTDHEAVFTVIGSIGLQGIRLCNPGFGETIVVTGLGLIGLLTAQMLLANGCRVIGIDIDEKKCALAEKWGVVTINPGKGANPVKSVSDLTGETGADGVIITASAKNDDIMAQAAQMSRKRGRIILVGVVGLNINRADFYQKELTFQVSCSYGPGRYDESYEMKGIDYPLPFVRWTEKRNFEAVLHSISNGTLKVGELISEIVGLDDYYKIYKDIGHSESIASILKYPEEDTKSAIKRNGQDIFFPGHPPLIGKKGIIGVIGAGNFTKMTMLPALKGSGAGYKYIASSEGVSGTSLAKKFGFRHSTTDYKKILKDIEVDTVLITTRHNSHAKLVIESLQAGKNVFVEKPLALNNNDLNKIIEAYSSLTIPLSHTPSLTVGFNRRFSPHIQAVKKAIGNKPGNVNIIATMNAGFIPSSSWVHDLNIGGGRIIGEACHYIDLCVYLTGSEIKSVCMNAMGEDPAENTDNATILLKHENGSTAVINYFANGSKLYNKERLEVFSRERIFIIDNFITTKAYGARGFRNIRTRIDKGHKIQFHSFIKHIKSGGNPLIPFAEIVNVTRSSFAAIESMKKKRWIDVADLKHDI